jgi:hypothetical protein
MGTKLQATTNYNGVIELEKYSELKQLILDKIAQEEDTEQVQKLTKILFDIDKNVESVKTNSLSNEEKIKQSIQARRIDLAKQSIMLLSGIGLTIFGIYSPFINSDGYFGAFLTSIGLSFLGGSSNLIKLFLTSFNKNKE